MYNCSQLSHFTLDETSKYLTQCSTNFSSVGVNLTVSVESSNHDGSDLATCQDLCANDPLCLSFHHSQGDLQCRQSTSDGSTPGSASGCDACQFYTKDCLPGLKTHCIHQTFIISVKYFVLSKNVSHINWRFSESTLDIWIKNICNLLDLFIKFATLITLTHIYKYSLFLEFVGKWFFWNIYHSKSMHCMLQKELTYVC